MSISDQGFLISNNAGFTEFDPQKDKWPRLIVVTITTNDLDTLEWLINEGLDVNQECYFGDTIPFTHYEQFVWLIDNGARMDHLTYLDVNILHWMFVLHDFAIRYEQKVLGEVIVDMYSYVQQNFPQE